MLGVPKKLKGPELDWEAFEILEKQPSRPLRYIGEGGATVEITTRTLQGRFLMLPSPAANSIILGVLGRALKNHPTVKLFGFFFLSNHYNLLAFFPDVYEMARFMNFLNSNLARELGKLYDWREKFFGRRYRALVVVDKTSQVKRLAYLLAQGTKEGLVSRPMEWPGANCLRDLIDGETAHGIWTDRTALYRARKANPSARAKDFQIRYEVPLSPLPCWNDLDPVVRRGRVMELVDAIEEKARLRNLELRRKPMGIARILAQQPHDHPAKIAKSPAPMCHASSRRQFWKYANAYRTFVKSFVAASRSLRAGDRSAMDRFPSGCFPPATPLRVSSTPGIAA